MARFETEGLEDLIAEMDYYDRASGPTADKMLLAAAEEVKRAWKDEAARRKFRDTGDMINSIGYPRKVSRMSDLLWIDIYPQGKDGKGVRNAEKAFILHWGTTSSKAQARRKKKKFGGPGIPRTLWIDDADRNAGPEALRVMTEIWDDFLKGK